MFRVCVRFPRSSRLFRARTVSTCVAVFARSGSTKPGVGPPSPEERLRGLKSAEKRIAIFAGVSLLLGYTALKLSFSSMSSKNTQEEKSSSPPSLFLPRPLVVAGPSGSGKSTLLRRLFKDYPNSFGFSVSHTTRKPREGEVDGREYHFTTREEMRKSINAGNFIEWAEYSGNMYGTSKRAVQDVQAVGKCCVLDIDMQGVRSMKKTDLNPVYVLIRPPSLEALEKRLRNRQTESEESLQKRMKTATEELKYAATPGAFDHTVVNDTVEEAYQQLRGIVVKDVNVGTGGDTGDAAEP